MSPEPKERWSFTSRCPLTGWIGMGRKFGFHGGRSTKGRVIQDIQILLHRHATHRLDQRYCDPNLPLAWSSVCSRRPRSSWHLPRGVVRSPSHPRCIVRRSSQTGGAAVCSPESARADFWKMSNDWVWDQKGRDDRTNDTRGSDALLHKGGIPTGCQNNTQPTASGSAALGRWRADQ